jgi:hypothetical protein
MRQEIKQEELDVLTDAYHSLCHCGAKKSEVTESYFRAANTLLAIASLTKALEVGMYGNPGNGAVLQVESWEGLEKNLVFPKPS